MKALIALLFCLTGYTAHAQKIFIAGGMRSDTADGESSGVNADGGVGFQAGGIVHYDAGSLKLRTGVEYVNKKFDVTQGSTVLGNARLSYLEVPVGALIAVNNYASAFAGANFAFNIGKESAGGVNTLPIGVQLGGYFDIAPRFGIELYYEMGFTNLADEIKAPRALVAQLLFSF